MAKEPAKYDRRIGFERFDGSSWNALNEPEGAWVLFGQTLASRIDVKDAEKIGAGREAAALVARFKVRSTAVTRDLTPSDRMVLSGRWDEQGALISGEIWDIDGVKEVPGETNLAVEITAVLNREAQV